MRCQIELEARHLLAKDLNVDGRSDTVLRARRQLMLEQHNTNIVLNPTGICNYVICDEKSYDRWQ